MLRLAAVSLLLTAQACEKTGAAHAERAEAVAPERPRPPPLVGPHRTLYDFEANLPAAVRYRDGTMLIDCGHLDFLKYVHGGFRANWYLRRRFEDRAVAFVAGTSAALRVPLDGGAEDLTLSATLRPMARKQRVSILVNEKMVKTEELTDDSWQTIRVPLASTQVGENKLRFQFRASGSAPVGNSAAAFASIEIAPSKPTAGARHSYFVWVPEKSKLVLDATSSALLARDGTAASEILRPGDQVADLAKWQGQFVRFDISGKLEGAKIVTPEQGAVAQEATKPTQAKNVFIWMIDTLRTDHVGAYNPKTDVKTPNLDDFAQRGVLFRNAAVQGNWSLTSHASLLAGVYPAQHRGYDEKSRISPSLEFAGEIFQRHGFTTATFLSNGYVSEKWGFNQGWGHYRNFIRESKPSHAEYLWKNALEWISTRKPEERLFVYLSTIDPHVIYNPPKPYAAMYHPEPYQGIVKPTMTGLLLGKIKAGKATLDDRDKRYLHALYKGEITYNDHWFGQMQKDLEAIGRLKESVILVVSDHGDEFYDHGSVGHGHSVYEEIVSTPLLLGGAGIPAGREVGVDVETVDVLPTLLELTGLPAAESVQGESLVPQLFGAIPTAARPAFSTQGGSLFGMKLAQLKLVTMSPDRTEIYDLGADPSEQKNIASERPIAARAALTAFALHYPFAKEWRKTDWGVSSNLLPQYRKELGP